jgi:hypothetical protein
MPRGLPLFLTCALALGCSSTEEAPQDPGAAAADPPADTPDQPDPPPPPPFGNAPADDAEAALVADLERPLYDAIEAGAEADLPAGALELACTQDGLADGALERLAKNAAEQKVALGPLRLIRLEGPALATACRPVAAGAGILAPLFRVQEPASRWRVRAFRGELEAALAALGGGAPSAPPRLIVVEGERRALALPLAAQEP